MNTKRIPFKKRFLAKFTKGEKSECWIWSGAPNKGNGGYGMMREAGRHGRQEGAHRASYRFFKGDPGKFMVCHHCDNRLCVNPDHLYLGTAKDNARDMVDRGRCKTRGEDSWIAKLTEAQVIEIRKDTRKLCEIAKSYGIGLTTAHYVRTRKTWRHVKSL